MTESVVAETGADCNRTRRAFDVQICARVAGQACLANMTIRSPPTKPPTLWFAGDPWRGVRQRYQCSIGP